MAVETLTPVRPSSREGVWIEVHLDRIRKNLEALRQKIRPFTRVTAVIKANAYGHGLIPIAQTLQGKVDFLGIGSLKEASLLRERGITAPLFLFGRLFLEQIPLALQMNLTVTISSFEEAKDVSEVSCEQGRETAVHIKIDTGMRRLGIPEAAALSEIHRIAALPGLKLEGIYTHLPAAEKYPDALGQEELLRFEILIQELRRRHLSFALRHAANSAGALRFNSPSLNLVRPGLALYGIHPTPSFQKEITLLPALSLKTRIVFLKSLEPGDSIGYGRTFVAEKSTLVAVLPVGYAHGYPFHLSSRAQVLHAGTRHPVAGRVCMDSMMVDLGRNGNPRMGDEVTLLGGEHENEISAPEMARLAGTIPYEIVTRLDSGIPRFYFDSDLPAPLQNPALQTN